MQFIICTQNGYLVVLAWVTPQHMVCMVYIHWTHCPLPIELFCASSEYLHVQSAPLVHLELRVSQFTLPTHSIHHKSALAHTVS